MNRVTLIRFCREVSKETVILQVLPPRSNYQGEIRVVLQEDGNVISERESARIVWTRLYFDFRCLRCLSSQTSSGRHFAGFTVAIKTPGICVNFALKNEIMLFGIISGIISELISRITWSFPLVYWVYFGKIYRFIYAAFPKGNNRWQTPDPRFQGSVHL